jgi:hypothetical protein
MAIHVALTRMPDSRDLREQEAKLRADVEAPWIRPFADDRPGLQLVWRLGFIDAITLDYDTRGRPDPDAARLRDLLALPGARIVRSLSILNEDGQCNGGHPINVRPLWPWLARLEKLVLRGFCVDLGHIEAPKLRHFEMVVDYRDDWALVEALANAKWPSLETFILHGSLMDEIVLMMQPKRLAHCEIK